MDEDTRVELLEDVARELEEERVAITASVQELASANKVGKDSTLSNIK